MRSVSPPPTRLGLTGMAGVEASRGVREPHRGGRRRDEARSRADRQGICAATPPWSRPLPRRCRAILPARFATTVVDRDELSVHPYVAQPRCAAASGPSVRARCQMTIRMVGQTPVMRRSGSDSGDALYRGQTPEWGDSRRTQCLRQRMATAVRARAIPAFEPIRVAVERFVKDERVEKRADVVTVNHLVPRTAVTRYRVAVTRAAGENHLRLMVSGPWAPYAFADNW